MSGRAFGWAFNTVPFLNEPTEKLVLLKLAHRVKEGDDSGWVWPGVDRTAADLGISRRSVLRAQKVLEDLGLIVVERRANKTSNIFLQLNFLLDVGDTVAPQTVLKIQPKVTASHSAGATTAPLDVPARHPNKTINQTMNKKQHQPDVVVFEKIVWEKPLADSEKTACEFLLAAADLPLGTCQKFADEMAGSGRREPIRNPVGWLKNMISRYGCPGFAFGYADQVSAVRAGRAAQAQRESLALPPPPPPLSAPPVRALSSAGRAELAKMGRYLEPATSR